MPTIFWIDLPLLVRLLATAKPSFPQWQDTLNPQKKGRKVHPCSPIERAKGLNKSNKR
jgi:hypothetical protein